jgi:hypothetical protein
MSLRKGVENGAVSVSPGENEVRGVGQDTAQMKQVDKWKARWWE